MNLMHEAAKAMMLVDGKLDARSFQNGCKVALEALGMTVKAEVACPYWGRNGRLDLVAEKDGWKVAIELDHREVRIRSKAKLSACGMDAIAVLREDPCTGRPMAYEAWMEGHLMRSWRRCEARRQRKFKRVLGQYYRGLPR